MKHGFLFVLQWRHTNWHFKKEWKRYQFSRFFVFFWKLTSMKKIRRSMYALRFLMESRKLEKKGTSFCLLAFWHSFHAFLNGDIIFWLSTRYDANAKWIKKWSEINIRRSSLTFQKQPMFNSMTPFSPCTKKNRNTPACCRISSILKWDSYDFIHVACLCNEQQQKRTPKTVHA